MKEFKVTFRKNGLDYETAWKALSEIHCITDIEKMFTSFPDYDALYPQNVVLTVTEIKEEQQ